MPVVASGAIASAIPATEAEKAIMPFILICKLLPVEDSTIATMLTAEAKPIIGATALFPSFARPVIALANSARDAIITATPAILASAPSPLFNLYAPLAARSAGFGKFAVSLVVS